VTWALPGNALAIRVRGGARGSRRTAASHRVSEAAFALGGELERGSDVGLGELGEVGDDLLARHPAGEVLQHVVDRDPGADEARLAAAHPVAYIDQRRSLHARHATARGRRPAPPPVAARSAAGDEGDDGVGGVTVVVLAAPVLDRGRARIGMARGDLDVAKRDAGVQGGHDERGAQHVRVDPLQARSCAD